MKVISHLPKKGVLSNSHKAAHQPGLVLFNKEMENIRKHQWKSQSLRMD